MAAERTSEAALVDDIRTAAEAMRVMLCEIGQRRAKGSGTTIGFPDLVAFVDGHILLIETKREHGGRLSLGQQVFIQRAAEHGVAVAVVNRLEEFVTLVNFCRRGSGVRRR